MLPAIGFLHIQRLPSFSAIGCMWWLHSTSIFLSSFPPFYLQLNVAGVCENENRTQCKFIYVYSLYCVSIHLTFNNFCLCIVSCVGGCRVVNLWANFEWKRKVHWALNISIKYETSCVRTTMNVKYSSQFIRFNFRIFLFFNYSVATFLLTISSYLSPHRH